MCLSECCVLRAACALNREKAISLLAFLVGASLATAATSDRGGAELANDLWLWLLVSLPVTRVR